MEHIITLLIQDDIKQTRLVRALKSLDIDATSQLSNSSGIVFELMGMKLGELDQGNEQLLNAYFKKIESAAADKEKANEPKNITAIIKWLEAVTEK